MTGDPSTDARQARADAAAGGDEGEGVVQGWVLLHDLVGDARTGDGAVPQELIAGGWPVFEDGAVGVFAENALHRAGPGLPMGDPDPVGTVLDLVAGGRAPTGLLQLVLRDCGVHAGFNADGHPVVMWSGDGRLCVLAATCEARRAESDPPVWDVVDLAALAALTEEGFDVLFNPRSAAPIRVGGEVVRDALRLDPAVAAEALESLVVDLALQAPGSEHTSEGAPRR